LDGLYHCRLFSFCKPAWFCLQTRHVASFVLQNLIIRTLLAVQPAMINDKHCFELYGWVLGATLSEDVLSSGVLGSSFNYLTASNCKGTLPVSLSSFPSPYRYSHFGIHNSSLKAPSDAGLLTTCALRLELKCFPSRVGLARTISIHGVCIRFRPTLIMCSSDRVGQNRICTQYIW